MGDIVFLTLEDVLAIHRREIETYGGSLDIRDPGLLDSAIHQPCAQFGGEFLHEDLAAMAAAYLYSIVLNHPFLDGNKRAGAAVAYVFLALNGLEIVAEEKEFEALVLAVAQGQCSKDRVTAFIRQNTQPLDAQEEPRPPTPKP